METQTILILVLSIVVVALAAGMWIFLHGRQTGRLRSRFGTEYDHTVEKTGSRSRAEAELKTREKRVKQFHIISLSPEDHRQFNDAWRSLQSRFVDNPRTAVTEADRLVVDLMQKRGYPMSDFEQRAADISVRHPMVVEHYRQARAIALRNQQGTADTEDLRKAFVHYRALFEDLLEINQPIPMEVQR